MTDIPLFDLPEPPARKAPKAAKVRSFSAASYTGPRRCTWCERVSYEAGVQPEPGHAPSILAARFKCWTGGKWEWLCAPHKHEAELLAGQP